MTLGKLPRKADFGDIVTVSGYAGEYFHVDGFSESYNYEPGVMFSEVVYDLTAALDYKTYVIADDEDVTVVAKASDADAFIASISKPPADFEIPKVLTEWAVNLTVITEDDVKQAEKSPTKQAEIDSLLDELAVLVTVIEICGSDDDYAVRVADVKRKLKEATK